VEPGSRPIPNMLRRNRRLLGYSQKQVAQLLGLQDAQHISAWEKGKKLPSTINLLKLCVLYRTWPHDLYDEFVASLQTSLRQKEIDLFQQP